MRVLDINQAAEFLHMHPDTVGRMAKAGKLPGAKPGKKWVFLDVDLAEWLRTQYQTEKPAVTQPFRAISVAPTARLMASTTDNELEELLARSPRTPRKPHP